MPQPQFVTELLKILKTKYRVILDDAVIFFEQYETVHGVYEKEIKRFEEAEHQLKTISSYKKKHGVLPQIKGHDNAESYLVELATIKQKAQMEIDKLEPTVFHGFEKRQALLIDVSSSIAKALINERDASQFIATMMLQAPLPADNNRCVVNEKTKPIYISAMVVSLLTKLINDGELDNEYITSRVPPMVPNEKYPELLEYAEDELDDYIAEVLNPIIIAALIHNIGSYCPEAEEIYQGNRYQVLDEEKRKVLIKTITQHTKNYLNLGLGKPRSDMLSDEQYNIEMDKFELTESIINNYAKSQSPMGNLLRIPMIYSSFMLSTKLQHDFRFIFKAYDIIKSGIEKSVIYPPYAESFLRMVGKYPLGAGISFISKETNFPERAVVSALNPPDPLTPVVKQLTRRQINFDDHTQVAVSQDYIISNSTARENSDFDHSYYQKQFPNGYFWNPCEPWEVNIDHQKFWRRDNKIKFN